MRITLHYIMFDLHLHIHFDLRQLTNKDIINSILFTDVLFLDLPVNPKTQVICSFTAANSMRIPSCLQLNSLDHTTCEWEGIFTNVLPVNQIDLHMSLPLLHLICSSSQSKKHICGHVCQRWWSPSPWSLNLPSSTQHVNNVCEGKRKKK